MSRPKGTKNVMRSPDKKLQILQEFFDSGMNSSLIELYIFYYNDFRPSYALNYKTPIQFQIDSGF